MVLRDLFFTLFLSPIFFMRVCSSQDATIKFVNLLLGKRKIVHSWQQFLWYKPLNKYLLLGPLIEHALWCFLLFKFWPCTVYYSHLLLTLDAVNMASTSYWNEIYSFLFGRWRRPFPSRMFVGKSRFWKLYQGTIILWNSTMHVRTPSMSTLSWSMFFFWPFICDFIKL